MAETSFRGGVKEALNEVTAEMYRGLGEQWLKDVIRREKKRRGLGVSTASIWETLARRFARLFWLRVS